MTAALNFLKNVGLSIAAFIVLNVMLILWFIGWLLAALFHGVNHVSTTKYWKGK